MHNKNFMLYIVCGATNNFGSVLSNLGILFLVYDLTKSVKFTSFIAAIETIPFIFLGLIGGVVADWFPKKSLLINLMYIRIPIIICFILTIYFQLYVLVSITFYVTSMSIISCFYNPAHRAFLPLLVDRSHLIKANSFYDAMLRITTIISTMLAGIFIYKINIVMFFIFDLSLYWISLICLHSINYTEYKNNNTNTKNISNIKSELIMFSRELKTNNKIKHLFIFTFIMIFLNTWIFDVGFLAFLKQHSSNANQDYSFYKSYFAFSAIFINLSMPFIFKHQNIFTYLVGSIIWALGFLLISINQQFNIILMALTIVSAGMIISSSTRSFMIQSEVKPEMHGRAFSFNAVLLYIANTLSYIFFGLLSDIMSIQSIYLLCSVMMLLSAIFFYILFWSEKSKVFKPF